MCSVAVHSQLFDAPFGAPRSPQCVPRRVE
jgi:hypothetical protein